jgi:GNAT superfamily N-acetyltransferase
MTERAKSPAPAEADNTPVPAIEVREFLPDISDLADIAKDIEIDELNRFLLNWPEEIRQGKIQLFIAYRNGKAAGRAVVRWPDGGDKTVPPILDQRPTLQSLKVQEEYWKQGIGGAIVRQCEQAVINNPDQKEKVLELSVGINNEAQEMYEKLGYEYICDESGQRVTCPEERYELVDGKPVTTSITCYKMKRNLIA